MAKKRYAAMALAGLLLLAGGCGQSSEPEMRERVRFNEFIQGLYQPGEGQYKVLDQEMQDITEAFIEATKEEAAEEDYLAIRRYAREEDVTIQRWEVEPGQVTMDTYQMVQLEDSHRQLGADAWDALAHDYVQYRVKDGKIAENWKSWGSKGPDFFELSSKVKPKSIEMSVDVQQDGKSLKVLAKTFVRAHPDYSQEPVGVLKTEYHVPVLP